MTAPRVAVAGAGLAGAAFAACAAARGAHVVVLERATRTPAGGVEAFAPGVHRLLAALSLGERARAAGFARQEVSVLGWGNGEQPWRSPHAGAGAYDHGCHAGYGEFVELLLARAVESGARVLRGAEVLEPIVEHDTATGLRYRYRGEVRSMSADLVADATGPARAVAGPLCPAERDAVTHSMTRSRVDGSSEGEFVLAQAVDRPEWTWSVPLRDGTGRGTLVVGGGGRGRGDGERWQGYRSARAAGAGWLGIGDAAGRADPVFLEPATVAVLAAQAAADAIGLLSGPGRAEHAERYTACYTRILDCAGEFASFCLDPARRREDTETLVRGLTELMGEGTGGALAELRSALAGHRPLFDVECPDGPLLTSLGIPRQPEMR